MKPYLIALFTLVFFNTVSGQERNLTAIADSIEKEGKILYQSEMASWYGTDIFLKNCKEKSNRIGGYLSYDTGKGMNNIFFSKDDDPVVLATMTFGYDITPDNYKMDSTERKLTQIEKELYTIRQLIVKNIQMNKDTLFKFYNNSSLNPVPIITKTYKRVYVITGANAHGVVIFGNDYLFDFNKNNQVALTKTLHKNIIPIKFSQKDSTVASMHSHLPTTGDYITATDICALMLYERYTTWKQHIVMSNNNVSIWDCKKNKLLILTQDAWKKTYKQ